MSKSKAKSKWMLISCMTLGSEQTLSDLQITYHFGRHLVSSSPTCGAILNIIPGLASLPTKPSPLTTLHLGLPLCIQSSCCYISILCSGSNGYCMHQHPSSIDYRPTSSTTSCWPTNFQPAASQPALPTARKPALKQLEANQLFSLLQNNLFNQQLAYQLVTNARLAIYGLMSPTVSYPLQWWLAPPLGPSSSEGVVAS